MSTDYGFGCEQCGEKKIVDNLRYDERLNLVLAELDQIEKFAAAGLSVRLSDISSYANDYLDEAIQFAIDHRKRGHTVVVVDEYGRRLGQCRKNWKCGGCGHEEKCILDEGHAGDCVRRKK